MVNDTHTRRRRFLVLSLGCSCSCFASTSQVTDWNDCLCNYLECVELDVKRCCTTDVSSCCVCLLMTNLKFVDSK